ncbi:hypothetical protein K474DRAFT_1676529 [Panus rudis PR-1116 ss-1]|nr:hypothetical protein K474DRAFT_1676529 [Panus rudis PR-1116 ss-1]
MASRQSSLFGDSDTSEQVLRIPPYRRKIPALTAEEEATLTRHALRLRQTMESGLSRYSSRVIFHQARPVTWTRIVSGQWLLAACADKTTSILSLWSISQLLRPENPDFTRPLAEAYLPAPVYDGRAEVQENVMHIALYLRGRAPSICVYIVKSMDTQLVFCLLEEHHNVAHIRCLSGDWPGFALHEDFNVPSVLNRRTGYVTRLNEKPSHIGGCIAMAILDGFVAIIMRTKLAIFAMNSDDEARHTLFLEAPISVPIGYAQLALLRDHSSHLSPSTPRYLLHVCITGERGLYYYQAHFDCNTTSLDLNIMWGHCTKPRGSAKLQPGELITVKPEFGVYPGTLSWLEHSFDDTTRLSTFTTINLLNMMSDSSSGTEGHNIFTIVDDALPDQHFMPVRDYDETRGIAVFGNGYGELALYDLSGTDPKQLEACLERVGFPHVSCDDCPVLGSCTSIASLPFPYGEPPDIVAYFDFVLGPWKAIYIEREKLRPEWSTEIHQWPTYLETYAPIRFPEPSLIGWELENAHWFLGNVLPVLMNTDEDVILRVGGITLIHAPDINLLEINVVQGDDDPLDVGQELTRKWTSSPRFVQAVPHDMTKVEQSERSNVIWAWERQSLGRDRWQELKDRGGRTYETGNRILIAQCATLVSPLLQSHWDRPRLSDLASPDHVDIAVFRATRKRDEIVPDASIPLSAAPPFPFAISEDGEEEHLERLFAIWRECQLATNLLPPEWDNNEEDWAFMVRKAQLLYTIHSPLSTPCLMEDLCHYFGEPILLMYYNFGDWVMFTAGGLLFAVATEDMDLYVCTKNVPPLELAEMFSETERPWESFFLRAVQNPGDGAAVSIVITYPNVWRWEWKHLGRHRWQDLQDREGLVHQSLLEHEPLRSNANGKTAPLGLRRVSTRYSITLIVLTFALKFRNIGPAFHPDGYPAIVGDI